MSTVSPATSHAGVHRAETGFLQRDSSGTW